MIDIDKKKQIEKLMLLRELKIRKARVDFWEYCKAMIPDFYKEERTYLKTLANTLQNIYERKIINPNNGKPYKNLALSMPPRHGKSLTCSLFTSWLLGKDLRNQVMTCSYNEDLGTEFSEKCRDFITARSDDELSINFYDVFARELKKGASAKNKWTLKGAYNSYSGGGFNSSWTGKGCTVLIVDDPVKGSEIAFNENALEKIYSVYTDTLMSRVEGDGTTIIIQTRWSKKDLIGRVTEKENHNWYVLSMKAFDGEKMLCEDILSRDKYEELKVEVSDLIFMANFNQQTIDAKGALYNNLKLYSQDDIPRDEFGNPNWQSIVAYIDTADKGSDYLALVIAGIYEKHLYILDILYTQEAMEITEKQVAKKLFDNNVNVAMFESNNGGGLFARRIREILINDYGTTRTIIKEQVQTKNKQTRILVTAPWIMEYVLFPDTVRILHREAWEHLLSFSKNGNNKHDDIEDSLTALAENFGQGIKKEKKLQSFKIFEGL